MRTDKYLWENVCMNIYRQMYKEAEPSLDFDKAIEDGITAEPNWFSNYYLPVKRQQEILDSICEKYNCNKYEKRKVETTIWLGAAPSGYHKNERVK